LLVIFGEYHMRPRAIVLLSGGLDSTTCLAWAQARYECMALSFMYGQRSTTELDAAKAIAQNAGVEHRVINIDLGNLGVLHSPIIILMCQIMNKKVFHYLCASS
jgi:7-cyano-7-deazaguanine synthase in queuosine biosynthesis